MTAQRYGTTLFERLRLRPCVEVGCQNWPGFSGQINADRQAKRANVLRFGRDRSPGFSQGFEVFFYFRLGLFDGRVERLSRRSAFRQGRNGDIESPFWHRLYMD
jgi:hypothetical protein